MPLESISRAKKFFTCRLRSANTSAGAVLVPLEAAVPTVVAGAVGVVVAVGQVVLLVIRDHVVQRETVVRRDVVDALIGAIRPRGVVGKQIGAAVEPGHQVGHQAAVAADELLQRVAIVAVPLHPPHAGESAAQLVQAAGIPGLGNQ